MAMDPMTIAALSGAGLGLVKGQMDKGREKEDRKLAAMTAFYSPWTGMQPQQVQRADMLGNAMQGGMTGAMMGQGYQNQQDQVAANKAYRDYLMSQQRPAAMPQTAAGPVRTQQQTFNPQWFPYMGM